MQATITSTKGTFTGTVRECLNWHYHSDGCHFVPGTLTVGAFNFDLGQEVAEPVTDLRFEVVNRIHVLDANGRAHAVLFVDDDDNVTLRSDWMPLFGGPKPPAKVVVSLDDFVTKFRKFA